MNGMKEMNDINDMNEKNEMNGKNERMNDEGLHGGMTAWRND